ncbi:MAG: glycoside hydrolase family 113 [Planctomycetota bacterium]|jgi:hypothetical protein
MVAALHTTAPGPAMIRAACPLVVGFSAALVAGDPPPAASPAPPPPRPLMGVAINAHHISDLSLYLGAVEAIADLGANALLVVSPMFQQRVDSIEIRYLPQRCPTDEQLVAILRRARSRGLHTTLLPIVLVEEPGPDDWRGVIRPAEPAAWWSSYDRFIDRFLDIALAGDVDAFSVGSELNSMESDVDRWRRVIERVRGRFEGALTYTANWDRYHAVPFWSRLDHISVSAYFELATVPGAPVEQLVRAWDAERDRLLQFARSRDRPLMLMEVGYPSLPTAAVHPWDYVPRGEVTTDHDAQARCYRAFFDAWTPTLTRPGSPALGFHCYLWDPYDHGDTPDTGYGVKGKPALDVIGEAFARIREAATSGPE